MSCNKSILAGCAALALAAFAAGSARAEDAEEAVQTDPALKAEYAYVEALIASGFPDFAETVIAETKKKWPESEVMFFALDVRGLLALNKFEEAEKKIAALPQRSGSKYWAARLEVANNYYVRGNKDECAKIYEEFFKKNEKPAKDLVEFTRQARFQWGGLLLSANRFQEAADTFAKLMEMLDPERDDDDLSMWLNAATQAAETYLRIAAGFPAGDKRRAAPLAKAGPIVKKILWRRDKPVYFGKAIAMKAHIALLEGSIQKAQEVIDDYMSDLSMIHDQLVEHDPDGINGLLRLSPMPQCRYLLATLLWDEARAEFAKPKDKRDDERVKSLLFGEKGRNGKRQSNGAFNHALNVFVKYPQSTWAGQAGALSKEIAKFAETEYGAKINTKISAEDEAKVRAMQFAAANEKMSTGKYKEAIADYLATLEQYPETVESVTAVENIVNAYLRLIVAEKNAKEKEGLRIEADAVEGYLAERFGGNPDAAVMATAGDAVQRVAALEKSLGDLARYENLVDSFLSCYTRHSSAATMAVTLAFDAQKAEDWKKAVRYYGIVAKRYKTNNYFKSALNNLYYCYSKMGENDKAAAALNAYIDAETDPLKNMQGRMNLAVHFQRAGKALLETAETNATPEAVSAQLAAGTKQVGDGIRRFGEFEKLAAAKLADPATSKAEKEKYQQMRETALYMIGSSWGMLTQPEKNLEAYRKKAVAGLEDYVRQYPKGKFALHAYAGLGTFYTILGDVEHSKDALGRLRKHFPDSEQAKKSMPRLAASIIAYSKTISDEEKRNALRKEATQIYGEMIRSNASDYQAADFANAGESLIAARSWSLADDAFGMAIRKAGTNHLAVAARAYIGKARSLYEQKNYIEAREALDKFMEDKILPRYPVATNACDLLVKVATIQGEQERDDILRKRHYDAAVGAVMKLRNLWAKSPEWKRDTVDLMSADVKISKVDAEEKMGLAEAAAKSRGVAAANLQVFLQSRKPSADKPIDKFLPQELDNLENAYAKLVPLLVKMGRDQASRALKYCDEYKKYFADGEHKAVISRCENEAVALGAVREEAGDEAEEAAQTPTPAAGEPAETPAGQAE